jgi:hypothetical protein
MIQPDHVPKQFAGPIDVIRKTVAEQGVTGMWKGVGASFIYRSCFAAMFGGESKCYRDRTDDRLRDLQSIVQELGWDELANVHTGCQLSRRRYRLKHVLVHCAS